VTGMTVGMQNSGIASRDQAVKRIKLVNYLAIAIMEFTKNNAYQL
jgi:hypothetical protein